MDSLTSAIVGLKLAETASTIQYAVAAKLLNTTRAQGDSVVQLIQAAGDSLDQAVGNVAGSIENQLDLYA